MARGAAKARRCIELAYHIWLEGLQKTAKDAKEEIVLKCLRARVVSAALRSLRPSVESIKNSMNAADDRQDAYPTLVRPQVGTIATTYPEVLVLPCEQQK